MRTGTRHELPVVSGTLLAYEADQQASRTWSGSHFCYLMTVRDKNRRCVD